MKLSENNIIGVVSDGIEIWKAIPGYTFNHYSVSNFGNIRKEISKDNYRHIKPWECKTSVGSYLSVAITNDNGKTKIRGVHQLVCVAFHGFPPTDGKKYEVNHKNGNKHNNGDYNLEWMTRSKNTLHALESGLRNDNIEVAVCDLSNGEWSTFYSIIELSRQFKVSRLDAKRLIGRHSEEPYMNRWIFKINLNRLGKIIRPHISDVKAFDYVAGKLIIANNATELQYLTGVDANTILNRTGNRQRIVIDKKSMLAGYVFKRFRDDEKFPTYTKEEALESRKNYFAHKPIIGIKLINVNTTK